MRGARDRVVVEAQAEAQGQTWKDCPLVASEPSGLVLTNAEGGWGSEGDTFHRFVQRPVNLHGQKRLAALVCRVFAAQAHRELVRTSELPRRQLISFLQAGAGSSTRLPIEETAFGGLQQQTIRIVALRSDVGVKALIAELRIQQACLADGVMILRVDLLPALMKIRRRRLRRKGAKPEVVQLLRIHCNRNRSCLLRTENKVDLRIGIETFEFRISF